MNYLISFAGHLLNKESLILERKQIVYTLAAKKQLYVSFQMLELEQLLRTLRSACFL